MRRVECEFEADVLAAVMQSRWPDRVGSELREHAASCEICSDVAAVALALDEAASDLGGRAAIPDAGAVWRRAQLRARREAVESANRPITVVQALALACAVGLLGAFAGATSSRLQDAVRRLSAIAGEVDWKATATSAGGLVSGLVSGYAPLLGLLALLVLLVPTLFFAFGRE